MKLILAWAWLGLVGVAFLSLIVFMIMQIPLEVWSFLGLMAAMGIFFGITAWSVKQIPGGIEDEDSAEKARR